MIRLLFTSDRWFKARKHRNYGQSRVFFCVFLIAGPIQSVSIVENQQRRPETTLTRGVSRYTSDYRSSSAYSHSYFFFIIQRSRIPQCIGPTGPADKMGTRISEVVSRYRSREEKRAKCRSSYLSPLRPCVRNLREYFSAILSADSLQEKEKERERREAAFYILAARSCSQDLNGRHSSTCNHSWHPRRGLFTRRGGPHIKLLPSSAGSGITLAAR